MYLDRVMKYSLLSLALSGLLFASDTKKLDSVTVTANKVEENIQDIPQSITVLDQEVLEEKNIDSIPKVMDEIPNMNAVNVSGFGTSVNFRGLNSSLFTNSNPVVIYVDGVPVTDKYSYDASLLNVQRVEVLRGPQGSLYGKDAIGGVINIVTNDTPEAFTGYMGVEYGSDNFIKTNLNLRAPLIDNLLYGGISAQFSKYDGWITNDYKNNDEAAKNDEKSLNIYLKYQPTDRLSMKLNLSKKKSKDYWLEGGAVSSTTPIADLKREDIEHASFDMPTSDKKELDAQSFSLTYLFNDFDLDFVSTHRDANLDGLYDADYSDVANSLGLTQFNYSDTETYTNELRLSNSDSDIKWVAGLYYEKEDREQSPYGYETYSGGSIYYANSDSKTKSKTKAAFGQMMIPLVKDLELTLGGRFQRIEKDFKASVVTTWGGAPMSNFTMKDKKDWDVFLPKIALAYKINENFTPYVFISKGYMPGGYNYFPATSNVDDNIFKPQQSIDYEIGIKASLEDFVFTASVFYMDIEDVHVYKSIGQSWYTDNAKEAHSYGLELEGTYFITDSFDISGSLGLIKAEYDDYDAGGVNFKGQKIENTPSHTASVTFTYRNPNGFYSLLDIKNQGSVDFYDNTNKKFIKSDGHTLANIKVGYKLSNWDIYGYVNNITDEEYVTNYMSKVDLSIATFNRPRFFGIGVRYSF